MSAVLLATETFGFYPDVDLRTFLRGQCFSFFLKSTANVAVMFD